MARKAAAAFAAKKEYQMRTVLKKCFSRQHVRMAAFLALFAVVVVLNGSPELRADALYLLADSGTVSVLDTQTAIPQERVIVTGAQDADAALVLSAGERVTVTHGGRVEYATTRADECVSALLSRLQISVSPLELVLVDVSGGEVTVSVGSDITYYETASEPVEHTTIYTPTGRLEKGEVEVVQQGIDGAREVVYEVVYADGQLVSRQAVAESGNTSVAELAYLGTRVSEAQEGDTVSSVIYESDGSGYLLMTSGDSLHFSRAVEVRCTAYTAGYDGVDTCTATGTTVRRGVVAVDKRVFPLGSKLFVDIKSNAFDYGMAYAEDTGMRGEKLDLYMDSYDECIQFGVRKAVAYVLD